jgi:hypothetical protein
MYDFPNSPTLNQIVTGPGGSQYRWDGTKWLAYPVPAQPLPPTFNDVGRNLLHNPLFNIQQRGAGPWTTNAAYTLDRFQMFTQNDTGSVTAVALADADRAAIGDEGAQYALQDVVTGSATAASFSFLAQGVETIRRLSGKTITISFWARATSGTPRAALRVTQFFGTGGSPSAAVATNLGTTAALSATWIRYSVTATIPSASGKTLGTTVGSDYTRVEIVLSDTSNTLLTGIGQQSGTVQFWGMQLEIGGAMTQLEKPDPQQDLAKCLRFYQVLGGVSMIAYSAAGAAFAQTVTLLTPMRANPTTAFSGVSYTNASGITAQVGWNSLVMVYATATALGTAQYTGTMTASADL